MEEKKYSIRKMVDSGLITEGDIYEILGIDPDELDIDIRDLKVTGEQFGLLQQCCPHAYEEAETIDYSQLKKPPALMLYAEISDFFEELSNEGAGELIKALFAYYKYGEDIVTDNAIVEGYFKVIKRKIIDNTIKYNQKCLQYSINGSKGRKKGIE